MLETAALLERFLADFGEHDRWSYQGSRAAGVDKLTEEAVGSRLALEHITASNQRV